MGRAAWTDELFGIRGACVLEALRSRGMLDVGQV
jgi:hypothetical protein